MTPRRIPQPTDSGNIGPLPASTSSLVGRVSAVQSLTALLAQPAVRLVTLTGPGGIGKSRLAVEVGRVTADYFIDGVQVVRLAAVTDPALVPIMVYRALGLRSEPTSERDWWAIREKNCLLFVDNFEQVREAADVLAQVLTYCPAVKMLVTSRVVLNLSGEHEFVVPPLATHSNDSNPQSEAVALFVERAEAVHAGFCLTTENAATIASITLRLDGLPLAIELAAAQCKHLSPQAIERRLANALDVLTGGPVDRPHHQRALRDTIAWSYNLLNANQQRIFRHLSLFAGGITPAAAAHVSGDTALVPDVVLPSVSVSETETILMSLIQLADNSLLFHSGDHDLMPRYATLATIRAFGQLELAAHNEEAPARERHAQWFLALAQQAAREAHNPERGRWLDWLQIEYDNLRLALEWFHDSGQSAALIDLVLALGDFWLIRSLVGEGAHWIELALEAAPAGVATTSVRARLLNSAGWIALRQGRITDFRTLAEAGLEAARDGTDQEQLALALRMMGEVEDRSLRYEQAEALVLESNRIYRALGNTRGIADTQASLGGLALDLDNYEQAVERFLTGLQVADQTGDLHTRARVSNALSVTLYMRGDYREALARSEQALLWYQQVGDVRGIAVTHNHIGRYAAALGDLDRGWQCMQEALPGRLKFGELRGIAVWLEMVAELLLARRAWIAAATVLGGVDQLRQDGDLPLHNHERLGRRATDRRIGANLDFPDRERAAAAGAAMAMRELIDFARSQAAASGHAATPERADPFARYGLTSREREIASLLVARLTDREIADRLFISPRTANSHVTGILRKLGLHSRREIEAIVTAAPDTNPLNLH